MKKIITIISGVLIALVVFVGFGGQNKAPVSLGSIGSGEGYYSTTTGNWAVGSSTQLRVGQGIFGSIIISSTTVGTIIVRDATTTLDLSSSTLARFIASPTVGTYVFDSVFTKGLILDLSGNFQGAYTITFK